MIVLNIYYQHMPPIPSLILLTPNDPFFLNSPLCVSVCLCVCMLSCASGHSSCVFMISRVMPYPEDRILYLSLPIPWCYHAIPRRQHFVSLCPFLGAAMPYPEDSVLFLPAPLPDAQSPAVPSSTVSPRPWIGWWRCST